MPRKKQVKNSSAEATIKYTGQVTVEKVRGDKVVGKKIIKNTGCIPLFKFFANCLAIASTENAKAIGLFKNKPQYLNCFYVSAEEIENNNINFNNQMVKSYMKQTGLAIDSNENTATTPASQASAYYEVNIRFLLQDNNFKYFDTENNHKINVLALYGGSNIGTQDLPHAYIVIDKLADYLEYHEGVNYIITWTLRLANK